ncbi:SDR family oxidoreductase [Paenibacillus sp. GCM10012307]|uniref:NmrA family NAD(P)-binding protein n=1 Tax=Paenibacillus roseus TaxID=2798579 RepID=A0A934MM75_9BACL|nr:NmrA family NAD(P)-binding protein [Paenibacillus roseus]MBJ6363010.1 NmrA family NAD(P)-binding protein [Paenibacillus roseus]
MSEAKEQIVVLGAGGVQGGAVAERLLSEGYAVRTIVRTEAKSQELRERGINAIAGDLGQADSLREVFAGAEKAVVLLPVEFDRNKITVYINHIVEAAKAAELKLLVVNTGLRLSRDESDSEAIELKRELVQAVRLSGIPSVVLEPTLYYENFLIPGVLNGDTLAYPVPEDRPIAWISIDETAAYTVEALKRPELAGTHIKLGGPEALTGKEIAERFSQALGKDIKFFSLPVPAFEGAIAPLLGDHNAAGLAGLYSWINTNSEQVAKSGASVWLDAAPLTLGDWINGIASSNASGWNAT